MTLYGWALRGDLGWVMLWWLLIGLGVAALVIGLVQLRRGARDRRGTQPATRSRDRAHDILDERFARGDIDEDEYRHRRDLLA